MKTWLPLCVLPLLVACGEGSLDPASVYGGDGGDDDVPAEKDVVSLGDLGFLPSAACQAPNSVDVSPDAGAKVPDGDVSRPSYIDSTGFFVLDGRLYDKNGNDFVIRGVNNAHAWFDTGGRNLAIGALDNISAYGFNAVRVVWETDEVNPSATVELLHQVLDCAVRLQMVPMIELHDVTGVPQGILRNIATGEVKTRQEIRDAGEAWQDYEPLPTDEANSLGNERLLDMAKYYTRDDVKEVLLEYEDYLLINIANEWSGEDYYGGYKAAIEHLRDNGINHTLVLDANGWGQNGQIILDEGQRLLDADPERNLLFSVHMYEQYADDAQITSMLESATQAQLPIVVGEFGPEHSGETIDVDFIFEESARLGTGYLGWSWKGNSGDLAVLDMSNDWEGEDLTDWGQAVVESPNGAGTSQRASMFLF